MAHRTACILLTLPLAAALCASAAAQADKEQAPDSRTSDRIIAKVGTTKISGNDLLNEMNRLIPLTYFHGRVTPERMDEARGEALDKLIEKVVIHQDAVERGIEATEAEVRAEFQKTLVKAGPAYKNLPPAEFDRLMKAYRPLIVRRILLDKNEARFAASLPAIDPAAVRKVYEKKLESHRDALMTPPEAHLHHIMVKVPPTATEQDIFARRARIEKAQKEIQGGKSFAEVARLYSDDEYAKQGGDLGFVTKGSFLRGKVNQAAFELEEGELSEIIRSLYGFHLIRCVKKKPQRIFKLEELKDVLESALAAEQKKTKRKAWVAELRARIGVEVLDKELLKKGKKGQAGEKKQKQN